MAQPSPDRIVAALMDRHGRTFAEELGIRVEENKPSPLFRLFVAVHLLSANVDSRLGLRAAQAFDRAGYRTADKLAKAGDDERWQVLSDARYLRKERTARLLGEAAEQCVERYRGDLRHLRDEAERDPGTERSLLLEFKGIGEVGADIFLREVQVAWPELAPYADDRVLGPARRLGLKGGVDGLAERVSGGNFPRLAAALVRCDLEDDFDGVREAARGG